MVAEPSQRAPMAEFERAAAESARRILAEVSERAREQGIDCATVQVSDFPRACHSGYRQGARVRSHRHVISRRRGLDRLFLGSQARHVLAHSPVPVLICK